MKLVVFAITPDETMDGFQEAKSPGRKKNISDPGVRSH